MEKYNFKIKEYNNQIVATFYNNPVQVQDRIDNICIQLKKFRTEHCNLIYDWNDGTGTYACDWKLLDDEINEQLFDYDLEHLKNYVELRVSHCFRTDIISDIEKEEKSLITSLNRTKNKVYDIAYANYWNLFITLTFDDNKLLKKYGNCAFDYDTCVKALHSFFTVLKRQCSDIQYLGVPELHHSFYNVVTNDLVIYQGQEFKDTDYEKLLNKKNRTLFEQELINKVLNGEYKRRFHFHFLFNNYPAKFLIDSGKKTSKGQTIYNLSNYKLGFTTATYIEDVRAAQHYITKYITKDLVSVSKGKKRYWNSKNLNKPTENNFLLDNDEYSDLKDDIANSILEETRKKKLEIEVKHFSNTIYKYVCLDSEFINAKILDDYITKDIIYIPSQFGVLEYFLYKHISDFKGYVKHNNKIYDVCIVDGRTTITEL